MCLPKRCRAAAIYQTHRRVAILFELCAKKQYMLVVFCQHGANMYAMADYQPLAMPIMIPIALALVANYASEAYQAGNHYQPKMGRQAEEAWVVGAIIPSKGDKTIIRNPLFANRKL
jgi:hypothetical protein